MSKPPSPYALQRAVTAARQLRYLMGDDSQGYEIAIESETDLLELADRLIEQSVSDGVLAGLAAERAKRLNKRRETLRAMATDLLESAQLGRSKSLERPTYTVSVTDHRHVIVTDQAALPRQYIKETPDKLKLAKDMKNADIKGATWSNPEPSIVVVTK